MHAFDSKIEAGMNTTELINEKAIVEVENELLQAMKNCDVNRLKSLLHDDLLFNIPNGQTITKEIDIESYSSGNMHIEDIRSAERLVSVIDDNAIVTVVVTMKGRYFDFSLDGMYKVVRVWKLIDGQLKVIAGSSMTLGEKSEGSDEGS